MANVSLDEGQLRDIIAKAVLDSLTPERREALIAAAVAKLLEPVPTGGYGSPKRSVLDDAFNQAVHKIAYAVAAEECARPELRERLAAVAREGVERAFTEGVIQKMVASVENAVVSAFYEGR